MSLLILGFVFVACAAIVGVACAPAIALYDAHADQAERFANRKG